MKTISNKEIGTKNKAAKSARPAPGVSGLRMTNQRALILAIIRQRQGHLDADEVYRQAREKQPRLSLSTVYRNLRTLKKLGFIEELHFNEEHHHYELKPTTEHHHLACLGCGQVVEFQYPLARLIKRNVAEVKDFEVTDTELRMAGYCAECRQQRK